MEDETRLEPSVTPEDTITEQSEQRGASFFSVPSSATPSSGVYTMPVEAFRFKDLDSGESSLALDERYWIKDVDTGNVYVVEPEQASEKASDKLIVKVSDLLSGEAMSLSDFERVLGYETSVAPSPPMIHVIDDTTPNPPQAKNAFNWLRSRLTIPSFNFATSSASQTATKAIIEAEVNGSKSPVKVKASASKRMYEKEFSNVQLARVISEHQGVVWTMKFSRSGLYLASAGQDCRVLVWEINSGDSSDARDIIRDATPYRKYVGHKQDVLDVAWSKTNLLLSASMDKTVRLWHPSMVECLRVFKHQDFVTAIDFHPTDERLFVSGSIDGKVRLWNIPDQVVVSWQDVHDMITAVTFSPELTAAKTGQLQVVVGTMRGRCTFFNVVSRSGDTNAQLQYEAQLDVKNKKKSRGKKITGLVYSSAAATATFLLVTSNDSRIRLYDGYVMKSKYKGHANASTQIRASFSSCGNYVVCGSDDGRIYVWNTFLQKPGSRSVSTSPERGKYDDESDDDDDDNDEEEIKGDRRRVKNSAYESFGVGSEIITVALFAPMKNSDVVLAAGHSGEIFVYKVGREKRQ